MSPSSHGHFQSLQREALDWLTRVTSGSATVDELRQFKAWRGRSKDHAEAYRSALSMWQSLETAAGEAATAEDRALLAGRPFSPASNVHRRLFLGGGIAASAAAVGAVAVYSPLGLWPSLTDLLADYHTGAGEQRRVAVTEKVSAELNTRTAIGRREIAKGEAIELIAGEIAISSTCSVDRPFSLLAGSGTTRSAQAKFDVRYDGGVVRVTCLEGSIEIKNAEESTVLQANQQVSYSDRHIGRVSVIDPAVITAWQRGLLIFRDEPLSQVIEEVNRYWSGRIIVLDANLGRRRVTARVELARIGEVISYVQTVLGANVRTLPGGLVLLS
jgi:transmembrane sensor